MTEATVTRAPAFGVRGAARVAVWGALVGGPGVLPVAIVVAAAMQPDYGQLEPVSVLAAQGAPAAVVAVPGFLVAGVSLAVIGVALWRARGLLGAAVPIVTVVAGGLVASTAAFRCSPGCPAPWVDGTTADVIHFAVVIPAMLGQALVPFLAWRRLRRRPGWKRHRRVTVALLVPILVGGVLTFVAESLPVAAFAGTTGLWQRIAIGSSLAWYALAGLVLLGRLPGPEVGDQTRAVPAGSASPS